MKKLLYDYRVQTAVGLVLMGALLWASAAFGDDDRRRRIPAGDSIVEEGILPAPVVTAFSITGYDSLGLGGAYRASLSIQATAQGLIQAKTAATSMGLPGASWTTLDDLGSSFNGWLDTKAMPYNGTLWAQAQVTNATGTGTSSAISMPVIRQEDLSLPEIIASSASIVYGDANGKPVTILVDATATVPLDWTAEVIYESSYPYYETADADWWPYKTAANGKHTAFAPTGESTLTGLAVDVGPRCYHTDRVKVGVTGTTAAGVQVATVIALDQALDYPYGDTNIAQPDPSTFTNAMAWSGSYAPSNYNLTTLAEMSSVDALWISNSFLFEGDPATTLGWDNDPGTYHNWDPATWSHWVDRMRAVPGNRNSVVCGFSDTMGRHTGGASNTVDRRLAMMLHAEATIGNVVTRDYQGNIPAKVDNAHWGAVCLNYNNPAARAAMADFLASEFNHSENRRPYVGVMFDVYELTGNFGLSGIPDQNGNGIADETYSEYNYFAYIADYDQNGIAFKWDDDEQEAYVNGRIAFFDELRARMALDGNTHFPVGANSVTARASAAMLSKMDMIFMEDIALPDQSGTGYEEFGDPCNVAYNRDYFVYHNHLADYFVKDKCLVNYYLDGWAYHNAVGVPVDMNSAGTALASQMRQTLGPWVFQEFQSSQSDLASQYHQTLGEVMSLFADGMLNMYERDLNTWQRQPWYATHDEGRADLHGLGNATGAKTETVYGNYLHWERNFTNGLAEILIKDKATFDSSKWEYEGGVWVAHMDTTYVDSFDYKVTMGGSTVRESTGWDALVALLGL